MLLVWYFARDCGYVGGTSRLSPLSSGARGVIFPSTASLPAYCVEALSLVANIQTYMRAPH